MTVKFITLSPSNLRQAEFGQFISQFLTDFDASQISLEDDLLISLIGDMRTQLRQFRSVKEQVVITESAAAIAKADEERDLDLKALLSSLKPYTSSRDTTEKEAYSLLKGIFSNYRKTVKANYETETAEINYLLEQLKDKTVTKAVADLDINRFVTRLTASQQAFLDRYNNRSSSEASKTVYDIKTIRQELQNSYQDFTDLVEIYNRRQKGKDYQALIKVLNTSRKTYADILARRKSPKKDKKVTDELEKTETTPETGEK